MKLQIEREDTNATETITTQQGIKCKVFYKKGITKEEREKKKEEVKSLTFEPSTPCKQRIPTTFKALLPSPKTSSPKSNRAPVGIRKAGTNVMTSDAALKVIKENDKKKRERRRKDAEKKEIEKKAVLRARKEKRLKQKPRKDNPKL